MEGRKATGVRMADGTIHRADVVIANADVAWTYLTLPKYTEQLLGFCLLGAANPDPIRVVSSP